MRVIFTILAFLTGLPAFAKHITGGEMMYEYVRAGANGGKVYSITLRLFRDAENCTAATNCAELPASISLGIFDLDTRLMVGGYRNVGLTTTTDPLPIVYTPSCLTNAPQFHYQMGIYTFEVDLPANSNGYNITYQTCCRVDGIENIGNASSVGATYNSIVPGSSSYPTRGFDSSPRFQPGISVICYNKPFRLDFSAVDINGDSLVYSLVNAYNGGAASNAGYATPTNLPYGAVPYSGAFTGLNPFGSGATINSATGIISGIAPDPGKYIVAVGVKSYSNGRLIAEHRKDFIITVAPCDFADASLNPVYTSCDGFTVDFRNNTTSPVNLSFFWDFGDGATSTQEAPSHTYAVAGDYNIKLVVNRGTPCADSATAIVKVYPGFFPGINAPDTVCKNTPVQFRDATTLNYGNTSAWTWNFGDPSTLADTSHLANPIYAYTSSGTYTVSLNVSSSKGCNKTITKNIVVMDRAVLNITNDTLICVIDTLQLHASSSGNGNFTWSPNYMISDVNSANPWVSPDVSTTYYVNYADNFGCTGRDSVRVNVVNDVSLAMPGDTTICRTDSVRLNIVSNGTGFIWTPTATLNNPSIKNPFAHPLAATTTYSVLASVGKCKKTGSITVRTVPYPVPYAGLDTSVCYRTPAYLQASGGVYYSWSPTRYLSNAGIANPTVVNPEQTTQYVVAVRDTLGCPKPSFDTVVVNVIRIIADAGPRDTSVVMGQPLQLNGTYTGQGANQFIWSPPTWLSTYNIANPVSLPQDNITYVFTVSNTIGCAHSDTITVHYYRVAPDLYVPTAFSPTGDGLNDIFSPIALGIKQIDYFRVYNRWGQLVYSTKNIGEGWDGKYKGLEQPTGTFVWQAQAIDYTGKKINRKGTVILIR